VEVGEVQDTNHLGQTLDKCSSFVNRNFVERGGDNQRDKPTNDVLNGERGDSSAPRRPFPGSGRLSAAPR
jgi:hypothetical protein